jgi:signal transduction histidine kinase
VTVVPWLGRRALGLDAVLAGASLAGGLVLLSLGNYNTLNPPARTPREYFLIPLAAVCAAVFLRRRARTSLAVGTAAVVVDVALGASLGTLLIYTQVLYDACVYGPARLWRWLLRLSVAATVLGALAGVAAVRAWHGVGIGVVFALVALLPVLTGISVRQYRDQAVAERERAEQTARLAELDRRQAVTAERTRMARELHDVVANHLSAVAIHATAALSLPDLDSAGVRRALGVIRESGVQGLAEMRRMIELLRDADDGRAGHPGDAGRAEHAGRLDPAGRDPVGRDAAIADPPARAGLDGLDGLVGRARAAGLAVTVDTTGAPRTLPVAVDLAAYRIVQESLTNALKHGGGRAEVTVAYCPDRVALTVDSPLPDGGYAGDRALDVPGSGAGLVGMRERTDLLAGRLSAGPLDGAGLWRVHAELPAEPS